MTKNPEQDLFMNIYIYVYIYAYKILMNKKAMNFKRQGGIYEKIWKKKLYGKSMHIF